MVWQILIVAALIVGLVPTVRRYLLRVLGRGATIALALFLLFIAVVMIRTW